MIAARLARVHTTLWWMVGYGSVRYVCEMGRYKPRSRRPGELRGCPTIRGETS